MQDEYGHQYTILSLTKPAKLSHLNLQTQYSGSCTQDSPVAYTGGLAFILVIPTNSILDRDIPTENQ